MGSRNAFRIAAAGRNGPPSNRLGKTNMGFEPARRKRVVRAPWQGPIPGSAIPARLINPAGFDKKMGHPFSDH
jgi:hypothetical protein